MSSSSHPGAWSSQLGPRCLEARASLLGKILGPAGPAPIARPARARLCLCCSGSQELSGPAAPLPGAMRLHPLSRGPRSRCRSSSAPQRLAAPPHRYQGDRHSSPRLQFLS
ncbi:hypothetical protein NDU88_001350 [Pleurodeles waltl]|uniref:Uncharacterized protein n=1 Tax=Pleurodeles waltl TaxID=8319 RepID=A0AAV7NAM0_PLEWA|nr:hypothetical protein NDU88_001350 [Pleurodeles waltl]